MSDHRSLFIDEALDLLDSMNNGLLALESDATDPEAMDAVFREAHTLKGNAAAMGLTNISSLAHALEDLLEDVRSGSIEVTPELMDEIFASVDTLETMVAEVDQTGDTATDPSAEIDRLEAVFEDAKQDNTPPDQDDDTDGSLDGRRVRVELVEGGMRAVDASFVLESLDEEFDEIEFSPNRQHVEDGAFDEFFEVTVPRELEGLRDALSDHPRVESATIVGDTVESKAHPVDEKQDKSGGESAGSPNRTSVRVDIERLEELHELIEQLVTTRIRLNRQLDEMDISVDATRDLAKVSQRLQDVTTEMRLVPFETIARGFPRVVRDTARELNKEIDFEMTGTDVEVDRQLLTRLKDPLIHVLRNAVDHGIEEPEIRRETGKPPAGQLEVSVERVRDEVVVEVRDDGGGIDADEVRERALDEGVVTADELEAMSHDDIVELLFHPGFSTAETVTDVSGRGVGMDVVNETVADLDGTVSIDTEPGSGSTVRFRLPVTMAIAEVMLIECEEKLFAVPISDIAEVRSAATVDNAHGQQVIPRGEALSPVIQLAETFDDGIMADGGDVPNDQDGEVVMIREETRDIALGCDRVIHQEQVVVNPLSGPLAGTPGISGTAVLGDQAIVPIIDVVSL